MIILSKYESGVRLKVLKRDTYINIKTYTHKIKTNKQANKLQNNMQLFMAALKIIIILWFWALQTQLAWKVCCSPCSKLPLNIASKVCWTLSYHKPLVPMYFKNLWCQSLSIQSISRAIYFSNDTIERLENETTESLVKLHSCPGFMHYSET